MRNLFLLGKISIFKTLAFSKTIRLTLVTSVPSSTIDLLNKIQKDFLWDIKNAKIKHTILCCDYTNGGLRSVDIFSKIVSLQYSWVRQLFDNNFHQWKVIPLYLIHVKTLNSIQLRLKEISFKEICQILPRNVI